MYFLSYHINTSINSFFFWKEELEEEGKGSGWEVQFPYCSVNINSSSFFATDLKQLCPNAVSRFLIVTDDGYSTAVTYAISVVFAAAAVVELLQLLLMVVLLMAITDDHRWYRCRYYYENLKTLCLIDNV